MIELKLPSLTITFHVTDLNDLHCKQCINHVDLLHIMRLDPLAAEMISLGCNVHYDIVPDLFFVSQAVSVLRRVERGLLQNASITKIEDFQV